MSTRPTESSNGAAGVVRSPDGNLRGRAALTAWSKAQPTDLYRDDVDFQALVAHHGLTDQEGLFSATGQAVAGPLDRAVTENNLSRNLPVLDDWDAVGNYTSGVSHHPSWKTAGRIIYGTGIMAAYAESPTRHRKILSLFYLTGQAGEAGHNCPLACAAGAIRTLQKLGTADQHKRALLPLLNPDFDHNFTASQFLTEVQGGSDVGANALEAEPLHPDDRGPGSRWRLHGEKWFCSNADADVFLLTARVRPIETGTSGLGLFMVLRRLPDGRPNHFRIRRLKDKLGTRSMASGEIDFMGVEAEALGPADDGFKAVMNHVITTSRLYNSLGCAAHARRAWVVASTYAQHRTAFGAPIAHFSVVQETLAWMRADAAASLAGGLWLAEQFERQDAGELDGDGSAFLRMGVNLHKLRTAQLAHEAVNRGIEILGGNGAIESFSILPRLLRDNVVYENWEGTHNVLRAQIFRDCQRYRLHEGWGRVVGERLDAEDRPHFQTDLHALEALLGDPGPRADLLFRRLADRMATYLMLAAMAGVPQLEVHRRLGRRHLFPSVIDDQYEADLRALLRLPT